MYKIVREDDEFQIILDNGKVLHSVDSEADALQYADLYCQDERINALALHLEIPPDEIKDEANNRYAVGREEYLVLTDSEADVAHDEALESYIDDCVLSEIPEYLQMYFDRDAWKRDARHDGRGHALSPYDGRENESGEFFIYRTN